MGDEWSREVVLKTCQQLLDDVPNGACLMFCRGADNRYLVIPVPSENAAPIIKQYVKEGTH